MAAAVTRQTSCGRQCGIQWSEWQPCLASAAEIVPENPGNLHLMHKVGDRNEFCIGALKHSFVASDLCYASQMLKINAESEKSRKFFLQLYASLNIL